MYSSLLFLFLRVSGEVSVVQMLGVGKEIHLILVRINQGPQQLRYRRGWQSSGSSMPYSLPRLARIRQYRRRRTVDWMLTVLVLEVLDEAKEVWWRACRRVLSAYCAEDNEKQRLVHPAESGINDSTHHPTAHTSPSTSSDPSDPPSPSRSPSFSFRPTQSVSKCHAPHQYLPAQLTTYPSPNRSLKFPCSSNSAG